MAPPINKLPLNELSRATVKLAFNEMSLELSNALNKTPLVNKLPDKLMFPLTSTAYAAFAVFPTPILVPTYKPLLNELSLATVRFAFNEMSLELSNALNKTPLVNKLPDKLMFPLTSTAYAAFADFPTPMLVATCKPLLNETSDATRRPPFMDTSPVKVGEAMFDLSAIALVNPVFTIEPPTYKFEFMDTSDATLRPAFKETSPALTTEPVNVGDARGALRPSAELNPVLFMAPPT